MNKYAWQSDSVAPRSGFYRHCSVIIDGDIYVIGGQYTKKDIYKIKSSSGYTSLEKLALRLEYEMYLHKCQIFNDRVWITGICEC